MLMRRERVAKPGDVGEIQQQGCSRQLADDLFAEQVFVADVDGDALLANRERGLGISAGSKVSQRHVHQGDKPAKAERDEFTERHQMRLVVTLAAGAPERDGAVEVTRAAIAMVSARGLGTRHARDQGCTACTGEAIKLQQVVARQGVQHARQRGLGQYDEISRMRLDQSRVTLQRRFKPPRHKLEFLRNVALNQTH